MPLRPSSCAVALGAPRSPADTENCGKTTQSHRDQPFTLLHVAKHCCPAEHRAEQSAQVRRLDSTARVSGLQRSAGVSHARRPRNNGIESNGSRNGLSLQCVARKGPGGQQCQGARPRKLIARASNGTGCAPTGQIRGPDARRPKTGPGGRGSGMALWRQRRPPCRPRTPPHRRSAATGRRPPAHSPPPAAAARAPERGRRAGAPRPRAPSPRANQPALQDARKAPAAGRARGPARAAAAQLPLPGVCAAATEQLRSATAAGARRGHQ